MSKEHIEKLLEGPDAWNSWRVENHDITPDLTDLDVDALRYESFGPESPWLCTIEDGVGQECLDLSHYNLADCDLSGAKLQKANLVEGFLPGANLTKTNFTKANLRSAFLFQAIIADAIFVDAILEKAELSVATIETEDSGPIPATFQDAHATGASFWYADIRNCKFKDATLEEVDFRNADAFHCDFEGADLRRARLFDANFSESKFRGANLRGVLFDRPALLREVNKLWREVSGLQSMEADFSLKAILDDQEFINSRLRNFSSEWPRFHETILRAAKNYTARVQGFGEGTTLDAMKVVAANLLARSAAWVARSYAYLHVLLVGTFSAAALLGGALCGVAFFVINPGETSSVLAATRELYSINFSNPSVIKLLTYAVGGTLLFGTAASWYGRRIAFWAWGTLFDYGRDWTRVAIVALLGIAVFGVLYSTLDPKDVCVLKPGSDTDCLVPGDGTHWAYPFFVAALGFLTLGLQSNLIPNSGMGQLVVLANVVAGWLTFGLLLAILQSQFAKRG